MFDCFVVLVVIAVCRGLLVVARCSLGVVCCVLVHGFRYFCVVVVCGSLSFVCCLLLCVVACRFSCVACC